MSARWLAVIALLASCEGRCRANEALTDEVPGALCGTTFGDNAGVCLRGDEVWQCSIQGITMHTAQCRRVGTVKP